MSVDTSWDIESYRAAYESDEHWELKRDFMEAHKDRIPETRLICLAQVFVNIELLGCKYPDEVMEQVAVLARDVGQEYKERKKTKLQRTFVKASDAAGARYKGTSSTSSTEAATNPGSSLNSGNSLPVSPVSTMTSGARNAMLSMISGPCSTPSSMFVRSSSSSSARLAALANPVAFVSAGTSNPISLLGGSSNNSGSSAYGRSAMSSNSDPSILGGLNKSNSSVYGGSSLASNASSSSMFGGSSNSNILSMVRGSNLSNSSMLGGLNSSVSAFGGPSANSSLFGGPNSKASVLRGSNSNSPMFGGSDSNPSMHGGLNSSASMFSGSNSNASLFGGSNSNPMLGGSSNTMPLGGPSASKTTIITGPPAPKKKKPKTDKNKDKPITEKFIKFIGSNDDTSITPTPINKTANTVPLQKVANKHMENPGQALPSFNQFSHSQPSSSSSSSSSCQPSYSQSQPSTAHIQQQQTHLANWCNVVGPNNPLLAFVLVRHENHDNNGAAAAILNTSSCFSRIPINYSYNKVDNLFECTLNINGVDVVTARSIGRKKAREQAVVEAVAELPKHCFTLKIKKNLRAENVTLDQVANDLASRSRGSADSSLGTSSVANKMMRMMGWTGGGLGKKGEGITEPIRPSEVFGRKGLGHIENSAKNKGAVTPAFSKSVREIICNYASNAKNVVLAFSNEFSKEQRAEIHKIARLCHLKSASHGNAKSRCLVISRKIAAQDLLLRLLQEGSNDQYQLIPPSSYQP